MFSCLISCAILGCETRSNFSVVGLNGSHPQFTIQKERTDPTLDERRIMNFDTTGLVFSEFKDTVILW